MKVRLYPTIEMVEKETLHGAAAVVIDVLRATSTIIAGMENGARSIIPVENIETASRLVGMEERGVKLLAGEWKGQPIEGFDLFNSPSEFTADKVEGRTVVLSTSNGTRAIVAALKAKPLLICSFNNLDAVAGLLSDERQVNILCAGSSGAISAEDVLCGGMLLSVLAERYEVESDDDATLLAMMLASKFDGELRSFLARTDRGRKLSEDGYEDDLDYCSQIDSTDIVPVVKEGTIHG
ncbi:MAG TPA: 2-phosphosulfolactate phosphatase [Candidatus Krumholzibacterium sp.]|nr:2-phosphosulfolactate phosphatase [Candidatus Krumholzibacterium sp.]